MSTTQCRHFVQNAWKKELCSNCFKLREEHNASVPEVSRSEFGRAPLSFKRAAREVQGILRVKESNHSQVRSKRKNVAFPDSLAEIIGYDGGDDFGSDNDDDRDPIDDPDNCSFDVDELPDSEEERALGNLTRANTNFNTVTANLTVAADEVAKAQAKAFSTLMLGRAPKDSSGKKKTLLVSVKPFGGDDSVPTAKRPSDKKTTPEQTKPKRTVETFEPKSELAFAKSIKKVTDDKPSCETTITTMAAAAVAATTTTATTTSTASKTIASSSASASLGKIVDMPLITSTNLITVMRDESLESQRAEQKRGTTIARTPAIKKPENEKPKIVAQPTCNADQNAAKNQKNLALSIGVELNLSPMTGTNDSTLPAETASLDKEIPSYSSNANVEKRANLADLAERKVEGEAAIEKQYPFEQSRESAGEPDGKADEEVVTEPPALPKSPPPIDPPYVRNCLESTKIATTTATSSAAEPRPSFLHGVSDSKPKPTVPQKPVSLPSKPIGSSLASLLSEHRAYEYRLSQSQQRSNALMHSQSETQLCGVDDVGTKRMSAQDRESTKLTAESCSRLTQMDVFKATCVKTVDKDEQAEDELDEEEEDDSEASSTDQTRSSNKRRMAPQPPTGDDAASNLFARNPAPTTAKSDCPVVREKEKRERASSCSPKFRKAVCDAPDPCASSRPPEPAPRRNISLSQDSLAVAASSERVVEEKKKSRSKFSLKKFLRMGSKKDVDMTSCSSSSKNDEIPSTPQPKPRLEIIHPLELDGAAVQVLRNDKASNEDTTDSKTEHQISVNQPTHGAHHVTPRPSKPPPPPRAQSLDDSSRPRAPSKQQQQQQQQQQQSSNNSKPVKSWQPNNGSSASDSIYANLEADNLENENLENEMTVL